MRAAQAFDVITDALKLWWKDWGNQIVVSLIAILASLTVILAPAALFGIFHECKDLTHNTRTGLLGFWEGFKAHFRQNLTWGVINLLVWIVLATNTWFYYKSELPLAPYLAILMLVTGAFWAVWQNISLACFFLQDEKKLRLAWKNGLAILFGNPAYALILSLTILALLVASVTLFIPIFLGSLPLIALISFRAVQATLPPSEVKNEAADVNP